MRVVRLLGPQQGKVGVDDGGGGHVVDHLGLLAPLLQGGRDQAWIAPMGGGGGRCQKITGQTQMQQKSANRGDSTLYAVLEKSFEMTKTKEPKIGHFAVFLTNPHGVEIEEAFSGG